MIEIGPLDQNTKKTFELLQAINIFLVFVGCIIFPAKMDPQSFRELFQYEDPDYWRAHPTIRLATEYEDREFEILAVFRDRVYYKSETVFKFYNFIDAEDETAYNEAVANYKAKSMYDTGVNPEYGDQLITLVTCAYHTDNGRFVVVACEKSEPN